MDPLWMLKSCRAHSQNSGLMKTVNVTRLRYGEERLQVGDLCPWFSNQQREGSKHVSKMLRYVGRRSKTPQNLMDFDGVCEDATMQNTAPAPGGAPGTRSSTKGPGAEESPRGFGSLQGKSA